MAGARALWRATGMTDGDFEKPIIAISNSFTRWRCPQRGLPSAILSKAILKVAIPAGAQDADLRDEAHTKEGEEGQGYGREGGCTTGQPCYSRCR